MCVYLSVDGWVHRQSCTVRSCQTTTATTTLLSSHVGAFTAFTSQPLVSDIRTDMAWRLVRGCSGSEGSTSMTSDDEDYRRRRRRSRSPPRSQRSDSSGGSSGRSTIVNVRPSGSKSNSFRRNRETRRRWAAISSVARAVGMTSMAKRKRPTYFERNALAGSLRQSSEGRWTLNASHGDSLVDIEAVLRKGEEEANNVISRCDSVSVAQVTRDVMLSEGFDYGSVGRLDVSTLNDGLNPITEGDDETESPLSHRTSSQHSIRAAPTSVQVVVPSPPAAAAGTSHSTSVPLPAGQPPSGSLPSGPPPSGPLPSGPLPSGPVPVPPPSSTIPPPARSTLAKPGATLPPRPRAVRRDSSSSDSSGSSSESDVEPDHRVREQAQALLATGGGGGSGVQRGGLRGRGRRTSVEAGEATMFDSTADMMAGLGESTASLIGTSQGDSPRNGSGRYGHRYG